MKLFLTKSLIFITIPLLTYFPFGLLVLPLLLEEVQGPSTRKQIDYSFENSIKRDYETLILGNSRVYRGLNPDLFSASTFNFSHDNDTYNQIFFKLKYLIDKEKEIKFLILGIDYFQFGILSDTRNEFYRPYFGEEYLKDYPFKVYYLDSQLRLLQPDRYLKLLRSNPTPFIKENGQYVKDGDANKNNSGLRSAERNLIQVKYFERILQMCKKNNIQVFLVMPPTRIEELKLYNNNELKDFNIFLGKYLNKDLIFFDFSTDESFHFTDFTDLTHLNREAADKFSKKLNDSIENFKNRNR